MATSKVCVRHFEEDALYRYPSGARPKDDAVPSIFKPEELENARELHLGKQKCMTAFLKGKTIPTEKGDSLSKNLNPSVPMDRDTILTIGNISKNINKVGVSNTSSTGNQTTINAPTPVMPDVDVAVLKKQSFTTSRINMNKDIQCCFCNLRSNTEPYVTFHRFVLLPTSDSYSYIHFS